MSRVGVVSSFKKVFMCQEVLVYVDTHPTQNFPLPSSSHTEHHVPRAQQISARTQDPETRGRRSKYPVDGWHSIYSVPRTGKESTLRLPVFVRRHRVPPPPDGVEGTWDPSHGCPTPDPDPGHGGGVGSHTPSDSTRGLTTRVGQTMVEPTFSLILVL